MCVCLQLGFYSRLLMSKAYKMFWNYKFVTKWWSNWIFSSCGSSLYCSSKSSFKCFMNNNHNVRTTLLKRDLQLFDLLVLKDVVLHLSEMSSLIVKRQLIRWRSFTRVVRASRVTNRLMWPSILALILITVTLALYDLEFYFALHRHRHRHWHQW